jgi:CDP-diacylglycerol--glycerol-3-phosphate 3-phosphatidyltransferase
MAADVDLAQRDAEGAERTPGATRAGSSRFLADLRTIPNILSTFRLFGVIVAASLYLYGYRVVGVSLGFVAGATDILDGYLARKLNQTTDLGAILDRMSDLVFEATAFVCVVHFRLMTPTVFLAYLLREMVVLSARLYVAEQGGTVPTNAMGRLTTDFLALSFLLMFAIHAGAVSNPDLAATLYTVARVGIYGGIFFAYLSGAQYLAAFARVYGERSSR